MKLTNKPKRLLSWYGHAIWYDGTDLGTYSVAAGDGTDKKFEDIYAAMEYCEKNPLGRH